MLNVDNINVYYDAIHAVKGVSLYVNEGEIVTLIGANGAGKSTVLKTVSGLLRLKTGEIRFMGENITLTPAHKIVERGLAQVPDNAVNLRKGATQRNCIRLGKINDRDGNENVNIL